MLRKFYEYITNSNHSESESPKNLEFTTQQQILNDVIKDCGNDKVCKENIKGICSQMSNLYAQYRTTGQPREETFLTGTSSQIYNVMKEEREQQIKLAMEGKDFEHPGFASVAYEVKKVPLKKLATDAECKEFLDKNHVLITMPLGANKTHQIYFGKQDRGDCILVDANAPTGKVVGNCETFYGLFAEKFRKMGNKFEADKTVTFASSNAGISP